MRRLIALLLAMLMLTSLTCAEENTMTAMETILSVKKNIPDLEAFDDIAIRARKELGIAVRELDYQWNAGKFTCDVTYGSTLAPVKIIHDTEQRFQVVMGEAEYGYLLYLPEYYDPGKTYPTILFLHGIGERGDDPSIIADYGPFQYILEGGKLDMIVIAPQVEKAAHWVEDENEIEVDTQMVRLATFIGQMKQTWPIDESRLYLTGLSMGGRGAYKLACYLPDAFAAVAACCGRAAVPDEPENFFYDLDRLAEMPTWLIHGLSDGTVDPQHTLSAMRYMRKVNGDGTFRMTLYPGVGHASYDYIYRDPALYQWLSQFRLGE